MAFSKRFPKQVAGSNYPEWVEVFLSKEEEQAVEKECRKENILLMKQCLDDASSIIREEKLKPFQSNTVDIAIALFEKRASHQVYWKESKAKNKFDKSN